LPKEKKKKKRKIADQQQLDFAEWLEAAHLAFLVIENPPLSHLDTAWAPLLKTIEKFSMLP
jgi:hypothetical protein